MLSTTSDCAPDISEAKRYLNLLDRAATSFSYQTFDDDADRKDPSLARVFHGSLDEVWPSLTELSQKGAGVFLTVNETNGHGRKHNDITRIRALWVEDDGEGQRPPYANFTVETSVGKHHHYVLVQGVQLNEFEPLQQTMVDNYKSDPNAKDRARVLRLPGFPHQKRNASKGLLGIPRIVRVTQITDAPPMPGWGLERSATTPPGTPLEPTEITPTMLEDLTSAIAHLDLGDRDRWIETGCALKELGEDGWMIWHQRSAECRNYVDEADCRKTWDTLRSDRSGYKSIFAKAQIVGWENPRSNLAKVKAAFSTKPNIHVKHGPLHDRASLAAAALAEMNPPTVFQRGQDLVEVVHPFDQVDVRSTRINLLTLPSMRIKLSRAANWITGSPNNLTPANPCDKVASGLLASPREWKGIPPLLGLSEVPILKPNGHLLSQSGYDAETMLYIGKHIPPLRVPENPTLGDAIKAADLLMGPYSEFSFANPDADRSVLLAYMLTMAVRTTLPTAPLFCFSASTPGSGKSLLVDVGNLIVLGTKPSVMPPLKGRAAEEETRKRITALLSQGVSSVNVDNWTTPVGGESMNVLFTTDEWSDRILGKNEIVKLPSRATWAATGNNLSLRGDMTRRAVILRLDPKMENPEQRSFKIENLTKYVTECRAELLSALFTILKAHQLADYPQGGGKPLGSFEEWQRKVVDCLVWIGYSNPVDTQEALREVDPVRAQLRELLPAIYRVFQDRAFGVADLATCVDPPDEAAKLRTVLHEVAPTEHHGDNRGRLGRWLAKHDGRIAEGYVLKRTKRTGVSNASASYCVQRVP